MTSEAQKLVLLELLNRLLKSWWTVVAGACIGASLGVVGLYFTTPRYEAVATIEADVERVPTEFLRRTVSDDVELQLPELRRAVLSDENLRTVITDVFGTPQSESHEQLLLDRIASSVTLQYMPRTQTITVLYRDEVPATAARIANMLAEFFVVENKGLRTATARQVRESMESLAVGVSSELEQKKQELQELLRNHSQELETQRAGHEQVIARLQGELDENEGAVRAAKRSLSVLESQASRTHSGDPSGERPSDPGSMLGGKDPRIVELERELEELRQTRTDNHPDVVRKRLELERRRAALESGGVVEQAPAAKPQTSSELPPIDIWGTRLQATTLAVERLERKSQEIRQEMARHRAYLANTPAIQLRVDDLSARIAVLEQSNREQQGKIEAAKTGQQLEEKDVANPFMVAEYAAPPADPVWPDRLMFLVVGVAMGVLVFSGPILARAILNPTVQSEQGLVSLADVPVLVAIPLIPTPDVARLHRRIRLRNVGLAALSLAILVGVAAMKYVDLI